MRKTHAIVVLALLLPGCDSESAPDDPEFRAGSSNVTYEGILETGLNRYRGAPIYDWTTGAGTFGGNMLGEHNPGGAFPFALDADTPDDAVVSTLIDLDFQAAMGFPPEVIDHSGENLPLQEALVQVAPGVNIRASLPGMFESDPYTVSRSFPSDTITMGDWDAAQGKLKIRCHNDGTATLKAKFKHLIPNGVYTLWHVTVPPPGAPMPFGLLPAGGVPNVWVADDKGRGDFERQVDHCPNNDGITLSYQVAYHPDGSLYGAFPDAPINALYGGTATIEQMAFAVSVDVFE